MSRPLLQFKPEGIYCEEGNFYIDPWKPVDRAVITHAHADHSRWGMKHYLAHHHSIPVMKYRLGDEINVQGAEYAEALNINGVKVSLHPAGHIIGSAQVRVEHRGEVWVVSGDYKTGPDNSCVPFEAVPCDHFITESTFGLPVFRWPDAEDVFGAINAWWSELASQGKNAVILAYSLGKAQRVLKGLDLSIGRIYTHGAVEATNDVLRGILDLPETTRITSDIKPRSLKGAMIIAPPSAMGTPWMKRLQPYETAMVSGWMQVRGMRQRRNTDRGFVLSDHADWDGLNEAVSATGAENIYVTHGYTGIFSRWLTEQGYNAQVVSTEYGEEENENENKNENQKENESELDDTALPIAALPSADENENENEKLPIAALPSADENENET